MGAIETETLLALVIWGNIIWRAGLAGGLIFMLYRRMGNG